MVVIPLVPEPVGEDRTFHMAEKAVRTVKGVVEKLAVLRCESGGAEAGIVESLPVVPLFIVIPDDLGGLQK